MGESTNFMKAIVIERKSMKEALDFLNSSVKSGEEANKGSLPFENGDFEFKNVAF